MKYIRLLSKLALVRKIGYFQTDFLKNFESICKHMVGKFFEKDAEKSHFNNHMEFRKKSIVLFFFLPSCLFGLILTQDDFNDPKYAYMDEIIKKELYPYTHTPIQSRLVRKYRRVYGNDVKYYCIHNGNVSGSGSLLPLLITLQSVVKLPNLEFLCYEGIETSPPSTLLKILKGRFPLLTESKHQTCHGAALFSNPLLDKESLYQKQTLIEASSLIPWENKRLKVVIEDASCLPLRCNLAMRKIIEYGKAHNELLEFYLPTSSFDSKNTLAAISSNIHVQLPLPLEQQLDYKYQLIIASNKNALHNQLWRFLSRSLIFITDSKVITWRSSLFKPWVHFVPVQEGCTNLMYQIGWALTHDTVAEKIAKNGQNFAIDCLDEKQSYIYAYKFLCYYATLYQN